MGIQRVGIHLEPDDIIRTEAILEIANEIHQKLRALDREAKSYAAKELLPTKNDFWLNDGEKEMSERTFIQMIKLESITVRDDGSYDFWYKDGDIFWGHSIEVRSEPDKGFFDASMQG